MDTRTEAIFNDIMAAIRPHYQSDRYDKEITDAIVHALETQGVDYTILFEPCDFDEGPDFSSSVLEVVRDNGVPTDLERAMAVARVKDRPIAFWSDLLFPGDRSNDEVQRADWDNGGYEQSLAWVVGELVDRMNEETQDER